MLVLRREGRQMDTHRIIWIAAAGVLALVGTVRAFAWSPQTALPVLLAFALVGATVAVLVALVHGRSGTRLVGSGVVGALTSGAGAAAFIGFALILGADVWALAVCVLVTSPYVVHRCCRWIASTWTPSTAQLNAVAAALAHASPGFVPIDPLQELRLLTDEQLQRRWSDTWREPWHSRTVEQQLRVVNERHDLLDELERRNPAGFSAWLGSHDQAFGGLPPRLDQAPAGSSAINWDALLHDQE